MNRDFLKDLGLEKDAIDKIMSKNGEDIEKAKGDHEKASNRVKELESEVSSLNEQIKDRDKQLEDLKKESGDKKALQEKIDQLEKDNKEAGKKHEAEILAIKKSHAIERALAEANAKDSAIVRKLIDETKVSVDGENLIGLDEQVKALQEAEATKSLFGKSTPEMRGARPGSAGDPQDDDGGDLSEIEKRIKKYK